MGFEHPYLVLAACVICTPAVVYLARFFFYSLAQFADETGFSTPREGIVSGLLLWLGAYVCRNDSIHFKVLGFTLAVAGLIGTVYHLLLLIAGWLQ
jgi:hypothetical protein